MWSSVSSYFQPLTDGFANHSYDRRVAVVDADGLSTWFYARRFRPDWHRIASVTHEMGADPRLVNPASSVAGGAVGANINTSSIDLGIREEFSPGKVVELLGHNQTDFLIDCLAVYGRGGLQAGQRGNAAVLEICQEEMLRRGEPRPKWYLHPYYVLRDAISSMIGGSHELDFGDEEEGLKMVRGLRADEAKSGFL